MAITGLFTYIAPPPACACAYTEEAILALHTWKGYLANLSLAHTAILVRQLIGLLTLLPICSTPLFDGTKPSGTWFARCTTTLVQCRTRVGQGPGTKKSSVGIGQETPLYQTLA